MKPLPVLEVLAPVAAGALKVEAPAKEEPLPNENPEPEAAPVLAPKPPNAGAAPVLLPPPAPAPKDKGADVCDSAGAALLLLSVLVSLGAEPKVLPPPNEKAEGAAAEATLVAPVSVDEEVVNPKLGAPAAGAASLQLEAAALELVVFADPKERPLDPAPKAGALNEDVGALDDAGVDASVPDADVAVAPKLKAGVLELKLGAAADAVAFAVVLDEVPAAEDPKEKAALPVPVAVSVLAALKEKAEEEADEEAPPPKPPGFASDPNVKLAVTGALSPFGADEPNEGVADEKLEPRAAGVAAAAAAAGAAGAAAADVPAALPSAASSASSSLLPVDSNPTSTFFSGHLKAPVTKPLFFASSANLSALLAFTIFCASLTLASAESATLAAPEPASAAGFAAAGAAAGLAPNVIAAGASLVGEEAGLAPNENELDEALESAGLAPKEKAVDAAGAAGEFPNLNPAAGVADAAPPKPPADTPDPVAGAELPNVKPLDDAVVEPEAAGALAPN